MYRNSKLPFIIVDLISKARGISHSQLQSNALFLNHWTHIVYSITLPFSLPLSFSHSPWLTELTSVVLGIGCGPGVQAVRLILDLNRVLTSVDLPKPLSPEWIM